MAWYIAITNPNCHRRAEAELAALGYRAFWPKLRKWVSHARVKMPKEYPILGRYLFVEVPDGNFWTVRNVNGVEGLLTGDRGEPAPVPSSVVFGFLERYMAGEWDYVRGERPVFDEAGKLIRYERQHIPTGARIRVMEGEFANLLTIVRGRRNGRLKFLPPGKRDFVFTREENARAA
jgi:hypothetical protein